MLFKRFLPALGILGFCLYNAGHATAQTAELDSLMQLFRQSNDPLAQAELALGIAEFYTNNEPDSASTYAEFAIRIGRDNNNKCLEGKGMVRKGLADTRVQDAGQARVPLETAYEYLLNCKDDLTALRNTATKLGFIYMNQGMYLVAQKYFYRALDACERTDDFGSQAEVESYLSIFYREIGLLDDALRFGKRAVEHARSIESAKHLAYALRVYGEAAYAAGKYTKAQRRFEEALYWSRKSLNMTNEISTLHNLARNYAKQGKPDSALIICKAVEKQLKVKKMYGQLPSLNWTLANVHQSLGALDSVIFYCSAVLEGPYKTTNPKNKIEVLQLRAATYAAQKNYANAYADLRAIDQFQDSLTSSGTMLDVLKKRESQLIRQLEQEHAVQIGQKELEKQKLRTALILLGIVVGLLLVSLWFYRMLNRKLDAKRKTIEHQNETLERLNTVKNRLFALISHDLRGPVNTAAQRASLLHQQFPDNQKTAEVKQQLQKTQLLLDNLLVWAKSQLSGITIFPELVEPRALATECIALFQENSAQKNLHLELDIPPQAMILSDPYILKTALRNILLNAIQHSVHGGRIRIDLAETDDHYRIGLRDQGPGFDSQRMAKILSGTPLEQAGSGNAGGKSGLGLAVCVLLLQQLGGTIEAENLDTGGSVFWIVQPKDL